MTKSANFCSDFPIPFSLPYSYFLSANKQIQRRHDTQHNDIQHKDTEHKGLIVTLSICDIQHKGHSAQQCSAILLSAIYAQCHFLFTIILSVAMLSVIMLSVVMLSVVMLSIAMLSIVMLSVVGRPALSSFNL